MVLGHAAVLRGEIAGIGSCRRFLAHGPDDDPSAPPSRLVVLHPSPPEGPSAGVLLDRMAAIRTINNSCLAAPMATGEFEGQAWVVEPASKTSTVADRIAAGERLGVDEVIRLMRLSARGLAGLHRRNLSHGALGADSVTATNDQVMLHRLGTSIDGSTEKDLHALGVIAWQALTGQSELDDTTRLRVHRPTVPESLERLIYQLVNPDSAASPKSATEVLKALDQFPENSPTELKEFVDSVGPRGRRAGNTGKLLYLGATIVAVVVAWIIWRAA